VLIYVNKVTHETLSILYGNSPNLKRNATATAKPRGVKGLEEYMLGIMAHDSDSWLDSWPEFTKSHCGHL